MKRRPSCVGSWFKGLSNFPLFRLWRNCLISLAAIASTVVIMSHSAYGGDVLILYDNSGPYGHVGKSHTILIENLLGHFDVDIEHKPVSEYTRGEIDTVRATFYLGAIYDEPANYAPGSEAAANYQDFLGDASRTASPLVWFNYNIWWLADHLQKNGTSLADRFGMTMNGVWNHGYNRVTYKDTQLFKGVVPFANPGANLAGCIDEGEGQWACVTELNVVEVTDPSVVDVVATTHSTLYPDEEAVPYVTRSGNFWFIGDMPTSHISEEDRYLVLADLLHDMLGIQHEESHRALIRLEDVSAKTNMADLRSITQYLNRASIPFAVSVIPVYTDSSGTWEPISQSRVGRHLFRISQCPRCKWQFHRSRQRYGCRHQRRYRADLSIVAHGYTHQSYYAQNPYDGESGSDFEFYRVTSNSDNSLNFVGPLPWDTHNWAHRRMRCARYELAHSGLRPFAWSAPHYLASARAYSSIQKLFPVHYGRVTYYQQKENETAMLGQFFPYPILKDAYGYKIVPENIGYYEPDPIPGYRPLYVEDMIRHARKGLVVRDGYASFFYHPPLGLSKLKEVVEGVHSLGYEFIAPKSIF